MLDKYFFDIMIYPCSENEYLKEKKKDRLLIEKYHADQYRKAGLSLELSSYSDIVESESNYNWPPWRLNQMVGYIRLFVFGNQIRGDYYWINKKRILKNSTAAKRFYWKGHAITIMGLNYLTNEQIFDKVISRLKKLLTEKSILKNRHLDLESFSNIGPLIDWQKLLEI